MKKTTKIIGAVLGVLLVAALFTGAVAAAGIVDGKTYYAYVPSDEITPGQTWYLLNDQDKPTTTQIVTLADPENPTTKAYFSGLVEEGRYKFTGSDKIVLVKFPEIVATAGVYKDAQYIGPLDGSLVINEGYKIKANVAIPKAAGTDVHWQLIDEAGAITRVSETAALELSAIDIAKYKNGKYALQPYFKAGYVVRGAEAYAYGDLFEFTIGGKEDEKVTLSAEEVNAGKTFVATVYGLPGVTYTVTTQTTKVGADDMAIVSIPAQEGVTIDETTDVDNTKATFQMGASGIFDISLKAEMKSDETTITVDQAATDPFDASIKIIDGVITAEAEYDAYTIGDNIKLVGTSSGNATLYIYIEGINIPFKKIYDNVSVGEEWKKEIKYAHIKDTLKRDLDAGTYTFYVSTVEEEDKDKVTSGTYVAVPVALKQSFISITSAPTVVAQGEKIVIEGTANAAKSVMWYLFGTNFFEAGVQKVKDDEFKITIGKEYTKAETMAAGQYFLVIQHPMYDGKYSIAPEAMMTWNSGDSSLSKNVPDTWGAILKSDKVGIYTSDLPLADAGGYAAAHANPLFDNNFRQTANAAQALCDALDSQNFDDMYAKASFIVGAPTSVINPIPAKIAQGEILKISGTTTGHVGDIVSVEFLATAFAAVPKEAVGTAAFVTVNTKVQDDGTWAIEFDTSNLNVDDYTVSVAVGSLGPTTSKLTVVKAGEPVPTQTTVPTGQPTTAPTTAPTQTPASPGFGILAALAGLGAVAVLLLRRQ